MTRLLAPEMFGVMTIATMILLGLALFSDFGLRQSVVQSNRGSQSLFLNTVWVTKVAVGLALTTASAAIAALLAAASHLSIFSSGSAYTDPQLPYVVVALGVGALVSAFESTRLLEATRGLRLKPVIQLQLIGQAAGVLAMLATSALTRSVWVLVIGSLISNSVTTILSHAWMKGTPNRFEWDMQCFLEVFRFGKWILLSSTLGFLSLATDKALLAGILPTATLGIYAIASLLVSAAEQLLSKPVSDVAFPAISEVARDRQSDLRRFLYKLHFPVSAAAFTTCGALLVAAPDIVRVLYDTRYHDAGWMLQILSLTLLPVPARLHATAFMALGKSRLQFLLTTVSIGLTWIAIPVGYATANLAGAVWGVTLSHLLIIPIVMGLAHQQGTLDLKREFLAFPLLALGGIIGMMANAILR
jgi:O-antigen/teichoic acid export membrane protein